MLDKVFGFKGPQTRVYLEDGRQVPVTKVFLPVQTVLQVKQTAKDGYQALQLAIGSRRKAAIKPLAAKLAKAGLKQNVKFLREVHFQGEDQFKVGDSVTPAEIFQAGDLVSVAGTSKGKGFAGVVKRWHFKGGPKTHGQSDRERAPGSSAQTTTPGRLYKGKRFPGHMGSQRVSVKNLPVFLIDLKENTVLIGGLIPGRVGGLVEIKKVGQQKNFRQLLSGEIKFELVKTDVGGIALVKEESASASVKAPGAAAAPAPAAKE